MGGPPPRGCGLWGHGLKGRGVGVLHPRDVGFGGQSLKAVGYGAHHDGGVGFGDQGLRDEGHGDVSLRVLASWHLRCRDAGSEGSGDLPGDLTWLCQVEVDSLGTRSYAWDFGQLPHFMRHGGATPRPAQGWEGTWVRHGPTSPFPSSHVPGFVPIAATALEILPQSGAFPLYPKLTDLAGRQQG